MANLVEDGMSVVTHSGVSALCPRPISYLLLSSGLLPPSTPSLALPTSVPPSLHLAPHLPIDVFPYQCALHGHGSQAPDGQVEDGLGDGGRADAGKALCGDAGGDESESVVGELNGRKRYSMD